MLLKYNIYDIWDESSNTTKLLIPFIVSITCLMILTVVMYILTIRWYKDYINFLKTTDGEWITWSGEDDFSNVSGDDKMKLYWT